MSDELMHYGTPRHSGRYPWGSGENPYQHEADFLSGVEKLHKDGVAEKDIAKLYGMTVEELRKRKSNAKAERRASLRKQNEELISQGYNRTERAKMLGLKNESSLRLLEKGSAISKDDQRNATVKVLKDNVKSQKYIDVGKGVASSMGISQTRLDNAVQKLVDEGYELHNVKVEQANNPGKYTTIQVLCQPGTTWRNLQDHKHEIGLVNERFEDMNGISLQGLKPIQSVDSKRVQVVYSEQGGTEKDGLIELRPGVKDLDLGSSNYAQVRIAVDGTHYLKGVAVYSTDLPKGIDIRFNTNKSESKGKLGVMKEMSDNKDNPFGATIKPGGQRGALNIVNEQGDWEEWSRTLSSQFLSKQSVTLAKQQLNFAQQEREAELKEIMSLTNPTVKRHMLEEFADKCDTAAVHLKAAAMPGQSNSLILPVNSLKPNEVYAPNYKNGTTVVLVRHPHGGTFELPQLVVNNRNKEAQGMIGHATDAIGIHHSVAQQLSGADFDGDTVVVIPNNHRKVNISAPFKELQEFDPKIYQLPDGAPKIKSQTKQTQMGIVSNLITDMTIQDAPPEHIIRAVKHSMVVIDSEKHHLDYRQSEIDNGIRELQRIYQYKGKDENGHERYGGAVTIISRASSEVRVPERRQVVRTDPKTGDRIFFETGKTYIDKKGNIKPRTDTSTQMREAKDAYSLVSVYDTAMERTYAKYANNMKSMARQARLGAMKIEEPSRNSEAAKVYSKEVESLTRKLTAAKAWSPKERNAQIFAEHVTRSKIAENPDMTPETKKKIRSQALAAGRARLGGSKPKIDFTDREWEAVQANAISKTKLSEILRYADPDKVKERALPKQDRGIPQSKLAVARSRLNAGYSYEEVARMLGISKGSLYAALKK